VLPFFCLAALYGQELLTNGDFEQELTVGWTQTRGGSGSMVCDRSQAYHPDPDYEAKDSLYDGAGWNKLSQLVDVPGPLLELSFWASFAYGAGSSTCWPVASVTVEYYDLNSTLLGETRFYWHSPYCNWTPSPTLSLHEVTNPDWTEYTLDIPTELSQNLPGVNPDDIARVAVSLYTYTSGG